MIQAMQGFSNDSEGIPILKSLILFLRPITLRFCSYQYRAGVPLERGRKNLSSRNRACVNQYSQRNLDIALAGALHRF